MDGWSFLAGGVVFGFVFFILGGVIGVSLNKKDSEINSLFSDLTKNVLDRLKSEQSIHFSAHIQKISDGDDGDDSFMNSIIPEQDWRNN